jgi:hypothetical protein
MPALFVLAFPVIDSAKLHNELTRFAQVRVPAADWPPNSRRKIVPDYAVGYPRYVGRDRGAPLYFPTGTDPLTNATGDIPQVSHTFAYYDGDYGMMYVRKTRMLLHESVTFSP